MNSTNFRKAIATTLASAAAIGATVAALTFGATAQIGGAVADPPPTTTPTESPDGNGWGHG